MSYDSEREDRYQEELRERATQRERHEQLIADGYELVRVIEVTTRRWRSIRSHPVPKGWRWRTPKVIGYCPRVTGVKPCGYRQACW
jgi:hypothetical protein